MSDHDPGWHDIKPYITRLSELDGTQVHCVMVFCESACQTADRFYGGKHASPWNPDLDIPAAFNAGKFKCSTCRGQAAILSVTLAREGGSPARYLLLQDEAAWNRHLERSKARVEANLRALRED